MAGQSLLALGLIALASTGLVYQYQNLINDEVTQEFLYKLEYTIWKKSEGKMYTATENDYRFQVFSANLQAIQEHNALYAKGEVTFDIGLNSFADLTQEEFETRYLTLRPPSTDSNAPVFTGKGVVVQNDIDWSELGAVTGVKNQGSCGSCWAFSATGALEGRLFQTSGNLPQLSEQELVDCAGGKYENQGCQGGWMDNAFLYVIDNGITTEDAYPYKGRGGTCKQNVQPRFQVEKFVDVLKSSQSALEAAVTQQPVSVAINASGLWFQFYRTGVFKHSCSSTLNHGVLAVGLGTHNGNDFFKVKNSWGAVWGDKGYIKMARIGDGHGICGIHDAASFPV